MKVKDQTDKTFQFTCNQENMYYGTAIRTIVRIFIMMLLLVLTHSIEIVDT